MCKGPNQPGPIFAGIIVMVIDKLNITIATIIINTR
jgi:hypothetical protein